MDIIQNVDEADENKSGPQFKYCSHCGREIMPDTSFCPYCGCAIVTVNGTAHGNIYRNNKFDETDTPSIGLNVLSFLVPILGLIFFCVYANKSPNRAKHIGQWAIFRILVDVLFIIGMYTGVIDSVIHGLI